MAFNVISLIGPQIGTVDTSKKYTVGTRVRAVDPAFGEGEFIYMPGVGSTVAGQVVIFDEYAGTTTLAVSGSRGPAAVASAALVAGTFGWFQIYGSCAVKETGATAGANVYVTSTAGTPSATTVTGDKIDGMRFKTADGTPSAGFAIAQFANPALNANG